MTNLSWSDLERECDYLDFSYVQLADEKALNEIVAHVVGLLAEGDSTRIIAKGCLEPLWEVLYAKKHYSTIAKLADLVGEHYLKDTNALFVVAYSYSEVGNNVLARQYYEQHANKHGVTAAVANNLGIFMRKIGTWRGRRNICNGLSLWTAKTPWPSEISVASRKCGVQR